VGDAEKWIPCPVRHGPRSFALRIRGISMFNPGSKPSFEEGDIGFFDPDVTPQPNTRLMQSCVVVRLEDKHDSTFKQLIEEGGRRYLKALNPPWPEPIIEVNADATICGVAIGKWVE
jgi:SOS-response transcriptional repressor LexA